MAVAAEKVIATAFGTRAAYVGAVAAVDDRVQPGVALTLHDLPATGAARAVAWLRFGPAEADDRGVPLLR